MLLERRKPALLALECTLHSGLQRNTRPLSMPGQIATFLPKAEFLLGRSTDGTSSMTKGAAMIMRVLPV